MSHTRTGLADDGRGMVLSEQALQNISPQFLQWCCKMVKLKISVHMHVIHKRWTF